MSETKDTFGVGFRPQHYGWVTTHRPSEIDVFEIVSENFMGVGGRPKYFLEKLRENYPIMMHGVSLSIGSKGPFDPLYLKQLKALADFVEPTMISDHLSWGQLAQRNSHDLLPIAYTNESMDELVGKIGYLQDFLGRRFFLENPSAYVAFQSADYDEAGFFAELLKRSGAGILLDVNNLYVNLKNLNQDPEDFLRALRKEDVGYFHLAGHSDQGDVLVDTHDHPVTDTVWSLYGKAREYFPGTPAVVEWDGNIPEFPVLLDECNKARFYSKNSKLPLLSPVSIPGHKDGAVETNSAKGNLYNYSKFFEQIIRPFGIEEDGTANLKADLPVKASTGLKVYNHAYFLRLEEVLVDTFAALFFVCEEEGFRYLVAAYLESHPPMGSSLKTVGAHLASFLRDPDSEAKVDFDFGVPLNVLADIAAMEWARSECFMAPDSSHALNPERLKEFTPELWESAIFKTSGSSRLVNCDYDILPVLHALDREEAPSPPDEGASQYLLYRQDFAVLELSITGEEARLIEALGRGVTLMEACDALAFDRPGHYGTEMISLVAGKLLDWSSKGLIELSERKNLRPTKAAVSEASLS
ncbi:MAG: DUF692 family protein [Proteobacteria bacterium]|nr:MAG: DUF692 family protein [Pseudomonadota bacterium]